VVGDKGEAARKDPRHGACAYGCGGRDGEGLDRIGAVLNEGEPPRCMIGRATMVFTRFVRWPF
jgi:hypothetical protein